MAEPLAIEGHRKLESAQQELFDAFSACYKKVNGRLTEGWQPHEMIMLCNDACFFDLVEAIREEIEHLTGEKTEPVSDVSGVLALIHARNLYLEVEFDLNAETLSDPLFRTQVLGELLVDLQSCRIEQRKFCTTELHLELTDKIGQEARPVINEIAQVFDIKASGSRKGGKGAYKGKGGAAAGGAAAPSGDERAQVLDQVADVVAADEQIKSSWPEHLLYPEWNMDRKQEDAVNSLIGAFNKEYTARRKVLTRRLDVTIQAFLWSPKADKYSGQISQAIAAVMDWRDHLGSANIGKWHMFATDHNITEAPTKVSSITSISSMVKSVIIAAVPDRGGVPEGYTVEDIAKDIVKANVALTRKDAGGGGKGASAQAAAALSAKRWVGKGMGGGEGASYQDTSGAAAGGGGGGAYYSKGAGGKGGDKGGGGGGYYGSKDGGKGGGGGGGYYSQQASGGGGGYYSQGGGKDGGRGGGGGGGGGWGGRDTDRPATAKGWSKGRY